MRRTTSDGFVLLIILIFLPIFILFSFYELTMVRDNLKVTERLRERNSLLSAAEASIAFIEKDLPTHLSECQLPMTNANSFRQQKLSWWAANTCQKTSFNRTIYYGYENKGIDPCGIIKNSGNNQALAAAFARITLKIFDRNSPSLKVILQSTIALPSTQFVNCDGKTHDVPLGRQSIRELS